MIWHEHGSCMSQIIPPAVSHHPRKPTYCIHSSFYYRQHARVTIQSSKYFTMPAFPSRESQQSLHIRYLFLGSCSTIACRGRSRFNVVMKDSPVNIIQICYVWSTLGVCNTLLLLGGTVYSTPSYSYVTLYYSHILYTDKRLHSRAIWKTLGTSRDTRGLPLGEADICPNHMSGLLGLIYIQAKA